MPVYYIYFLRLPLTIHQPYISPSNPHSHEMSDHVNDEVILLKDDTPLPPTLLPHQGPEVARHNSNKEGDPLAWDRCAICKLRGYSPQMFHCDDCEEAFHPGCSARRSPRNHHDPRFQSFTCKQCLDHARRIHKASHDIV